MYKSSQRYRRQLFRRRTPAPVNQIPINARRVRFVIRHSSKRSPGRYRGESHRDQDRERDREYRCIRWKRSSLDEHREDCVPFCVPSARQLRCRPIVLARTGIWTSRGSTSVRQSWSVPYRWRRTTRLKRPGSTAVRLGRMLFSADREREKTRFR